MQFNGGAPLRAGQAGLMAQFRISRIVSLTATGRYQFYVADIPFDATSTTDPYTTATVTGQLSPGSNTRGRSSAGWRCCGSTST